MKKYFIYCFVILSCTIACLLNNSFGKQVLAQKSNKPTATFFKDSKDSFQKMPARKLSGGDIEKTTVLKPEAKDSRIVYREKLHALVKELHLAKDKQSKLAIIDKIKQLRKEMREGFIKKDFVESKKDSVRTTLMKHSSIKETMNGQLHVEAASQTYHVPFGSTGNRIELAVASISPITSTNIQVKAVDVPTWLHLTPVEQSITELSPNKEITVTFSFSIDKSAPVNKEQNIQFTVSSPSGETWTKQIKILVTPPERFELFQNYPNPFNPTTIISYSLPVNSYVSLKVYNVLGQEVATLVNEIQEAGYKTVNFDGNNFPTGVYFYKLTAGKFLQVGKMMLTK